MKLLGIDIGTTTICGLLLDADSGEIVSVVTRPNDASRPGAAWESLQDPAAILAATREIMDGLLSQHRDVAGVAFVGQMHGILYVDKTGRPRGPLYTWQDGRGDLPQDTGQSTAARLSAALGRRVSTGMGFVTHAYNLAHGLVPREAAWVCTIMDFVAMTSAGARAPVIDPTTAASLGGFDLDRADFRRDVMKGLGIDPAIFPRVERGYPVLGQTRQGVPVFAAAGDNQASFIGSVAETASSVLVNVGTGSQVSVRVDSPHELPGLDVRPFPFGGCLAVGAALCGGSAYALLRTFFEQTLRLFTGTEHAVSWEAMNEAGRDLPGTPLEVDTRFRGTREDPRVRGSISGIGTGTFTPEHLLAGTREGIASELLGFYGRVPAERRAEVSTLVGAGNAIRMNPALRAVFEQRLGTTMRVPAHREEASFGAALIAGVASSVFSDLARAGRLVRYETA